MLGVIESDASFTAVWCSVSRVHFQDFILPSVFICSLVTWATKYTHIINFICKRLSWTCPINFLNVKLERRFSEKSVFLEEIAKDQIMRLVFCEIAELKNTN